MADRADVGAGRTLRARRWVLLAMRSIGVAMLGVAVYRLLAILIGAPQHTLLGRSMFTNRPAVWAAAYPALLGGALLAASGWLARFITPATRTLSTFPRRVRGGVRVAGLALILLGLWIVLSRAGQAIDGWEVSGGLIRPQPTAMYRISKTLQPCAPGLALLLIGAVVLAAQRPLVRLLAPRLGGCPACGYDVDESKQARCPECGLALKGAAGRKEERAEASV